MQVVIDEKERVHLDETEKMASGQDGDLYFYNGEVIKICNSGYMTYEKLDDLNAIASSYEDKPETLSNSHIVLPEKKVEDAEKKVQRLRITPLFGYTQKYLTEKKFGISTLASDTFIEQAENLREGIHEVFSKNSVGITDDNPHNFLVTTDDQMFFIDHDRCITKSVAEANRHAVFDDNFYEHNNRKFDRLINKALLLEAFRGIELNDENLRKVLSLLHDLNLQSEQVLSLYSILREYENVSQYAEDRAKELGLKM